MSILVLEDVRKSYRMGDETVHALDGVSLQVEKGDFAAILGTSGSGKSTLMNILGFMDTATSGQILFEGENVTGLDADARALHRARRIGFVFQSFNLLPRLSVLENVMLPFMYARKETPDSRERALGALERVGMSHRTGHRPAQLSGGERQRVAIARALINRPGLLLADEPTGALDTKNADRVLELFTTLNTEGVTVLIVTHDLGVAERTKRILRMRDGKIIEDRRR